jgi:hypothetical protein
MAEGLRKVNIAEDGTIVPAEDDEYFVDKKNSE